MAGAAPTRRTRTGAALVAAGLGATALVGVAGPAAGQPALAPGARASVSELRADSPQVEPVVWAPCDGAFECATVRVPLDHDRPGGATIDIALLRSRATSPERRIGSLFLNPGGPGGSGVEMAAAIAPYMPAEIRERFDLVGFDPRGVAGSTPLRCYATGEEALADLPQAPFPQTPQEEDLQIEADRRLVEACRDHAGPVLGHMSTADVARDLDLLRQAVGDDGLTYFGVSYGSVLGQTYANLFPGRVRALVIDGVVDPREWAGQGPDARTVPLGARVEGPRSAQQALGEFFRLCDEAGPACAISGDASARYSALVSRLSRSPVDLPGLGTVTGSSLVAFTLAGLNVPATWPQLAQLLHQLEETAPPTHIGATVHELRSRFGVVDGAHPEQEAYRNHIEASTGVACADAANPRSYTWYRRSAEVAEDRFGYFGRQFAWSWSACAIWPATASLDRYAGPWTTRTANPALVVGTTYDPSTGYHGAVAASRLLEGSTLLTYTGWGHTAFLTGNACVDETVTGYLVTPSARAGELVCEAQGSPFDHVAAAGGPGAAGVVAAATIPEHLRRALG